MRFEILRAGAYSARQRYKQTTQSVFLGLNISGVEFMHLLSPEGRHCADFSNLTLTLIPEHFQLDFAYSARRENYVIECRIKGLERAGDDCGLLLDFRGTRLALPFVRHFQPERCDELRCRFLSIIALIRNAIPESRCAAELLAEALLAEFLPSPDEADAVAGPAERLKKVIDADGAFEHNLGWLCRSVGMSGDYLRRTFVRRYGVTPAEYRTRLRLNRIYELLSSSTLSPKEIAAEVGMRHVTHLYLLLQSRCDRTPGDLRRQYRDG